MLEKGYVQVYTGNGKGKTTAMLGLTLRAVGAGLRVYIGQFVKSEIYSEVKALKYLPNVKFEQYGAGGFLFAGLSQEDMQAAANGIEKAKAAMFSGEYDIIALDEINVAVHLGLVSVESLLELMAQKPDGVELIFTGRYAAPEVMAAADLVSEMVDVKHYYHMGVMARDGIEQ